MIPSKVVLITGSSRGIGKAISDAFTWYEDYVIIDTYNNNPNKYGIKLDLNDIEDIKECIDLIIEEYGRIDILINNAGIAQRKDFLDITEDDYDTMLDTNLKGTFFLTQAVIRQMLLQGSGNIINIASIGGQTGGMNQVHYALSKAGIINLTKSVCNLYKDKNIVCNCIAPSLIETDMNKDLTTTEKSGTVGDVANLVLFLADEKSNHINGATINLNGGTYYG